MRLCYCELTQKKSDSKACKCLSLSKIARRQRGGAYALGPNALTVSQSHSAIFRSSTQRGREVVPAEQQLVKEKKGQRVKGPKVRVEGARLNSNTQTVSSVSLSTALF